MKGGKKVDGVNKLWSPETKNSEQELGLQEYKREENDSSYGCTEVDGTCRPGERNVGEYTNRPLSRLRCLPT